MLIRLLSKSVLLTKSAWFNPATKCSAVNLLNSWEITYLELSEILFSASLIYVFKPIVATKLLVSGILFSTSVIFVFRIGVVNKPFVSGIFYQHPKLLSLNFVYLCCTDLCELK